MAASAASICFSMPLLVVSARETLSSMRFTSRSAALMPFSSCELSSAVENVIVPSDAMAYPLVHSSNMSSSAEVALPLMSISSLLAR